MNAVFKLVIRMQPNLSGGRFCGVIMAAMMTVPIRTTENRILVLVVIITYVIFVLPKTFPNACFQKVSSKPIMMTYFRDVYMRFQSACNCRPIRAATMRVPIRLTGDWCSDRVGAHCTIDILLVNQSTKLSLFLSKWRKLIVMKG